MGMQKLEGKRTESKHLTNLKWTVASGVCDGKEYDGEKYNDVNLMDMVLLEKDVLRT